MPSPETLVVFTLAALGSGSIAGFLRRPLAQRLQNWTTATILISLGAFVALSRRSQ